MSLVSPQIWSWTPQISLYFSPFHLSKNIYWDLCWETENTEVNKTHDWKFYINKFYIKNFYLFNLYLRINFQCNPLIFKNGHILSNVESLFQDDQLNQTFKFIQVLFMC